MVNFNKIKLWKETVGEDTLNWLLMFLYIGEKEKMNEPATTNEILEKVGVHQTTLSRFIKVAYKYKDKDGSMKGFDIIKPELNTMDRGYVYTLTEKGKKLFNEITSKQ